MTRAESRFLYESNAIEGEYGPEEFDSACVAWRLVKGRRVTLGLILEAHRSLMCQLNPQIAGELRQVDVYVGGYKAPKPYHVPALIDEWVLVHGQAETFEAVKAAHVAFEKIHPFVDGNGRVGRIIMNVQLTRHGDDPMIIWEKEKQEYYKWFKE